jgi:hypothetical protein
MRVGSILVCDAVRPRVDGLFDAIGAGQQAVFIDPEERQFKRTVVVQLVCEPEDVGRAREVHVALASPNDEVLVGAVLEVTTDAPPPGGWKVHPRVLNQVVHLRQRVEEDGDYRIAVACDGEELDSWPITIMALELEVVDRQVSNQDTDS